MAYLWRWLSVLNDFNRFVDSRDGDFLPMLDLMPTFWFWVHFLCPPAFFLSGIKYLPVGAIPPEHAKLPLRRPDTLVVTGAIVVVRKYAWHLTQSFCILFRYGEWRDWMLINLSMWDRQN